MFDWKWKLADLPEPDGKLKVFSCFACGGGSSMGYKRAGYTVLGNCEIDPKVAKVYQKNLHPKYSFVMDVRDFLKKDDLPAELYDLDILDGSPPCSVFSTAGKREDGWNKEKRFAEGQKLQTLDDLFFVFLDIVEKLKPKAVIAENVTGLIKGNARYYVTQIIKRFKEIGYDVQIFQLNAAFMDVPQRRERIFFIANRMGFPKLKLEFHGKPIPFGKVRSKKGIPATGEAKRLMKYRRKTDTLLSDIKVRLGEKRNLFTHTFFHDEKPALTVIASCMSYRMFDGDRISEEDIRNASSFPQDYDFSPKGAEFICGMSVPPNMMANIAYQVKKQWFE